MLKLKRGIEKLLHGRRLVFLVCAVVLAGALAALSPLAFRKYQDYQALKAPTQNVADDAASINKTVAKLEQNMTDNNAQLGDRLARYDQLIGAYVESGNYEKAAKAFTDRQALSSEGIEYGGYYQALLIFINVKDKQAAQTVLSKAKASVPPKSDPNDGYLNEEYNRDLTALEQKVNQI